MHQLAGPADWWNNYLATRISEEPELIAAEEDEEEEEVSEDEEAEGQAAVEVTARSGLD